MNTIVVGYDGSRSALRAAREAAELARATGAALHVVAAIDDSAFRQGMITAAEQQAGEREVAAANEWLLTTGGGDAGVADLTQGVETHSEVMTGNPGKCILDYAAAVHADLIVVGNRRVQGLERVLGSVAVDVLRHTECSVYVAHTT